MTQTEAQPPQPPQSSPPSQPPAAPHPAGEELPGEEARARLAPLTAEVAADPGRVATLFPAVARRVARGPGDPGDPDGLLSWRLEDRARVAVLAAAARAWCERGEPHRVAEATAALYRYGDADEKRAVLRALDVLDRPGGPGGIGEAGLPLVTDALRSNDPRLIAAALGPYAARRLDAAAWRHGVLKCLFTGVPLAAVAGLADRADAELARMAADYVRERQAAGRDVPPDAERLLALPSPGGPQKED